MKYRCLPTLRSFLSWPPSTGFAIKGIDSRHSESVEGEKIKIIPKLSSDNPNAWRQYDAAFRNEIQTDGCLFMCLGSIVEEASGIPFEDPDEIERAYQYAIPNYMRDGGAVRKNRCYINSHPDLLRVFFHVLGIRKPSMVVYAYRYDFETGRYVVGGSSSKWQCNYFVKKVRYGTEGGHFLRCTVDLDSLYNPGRTDNDDILSLRGYVVKL